jgi:dihydroorotase
LTTSINLINVKIPYLEELLEGGMHVEEGRIIKIGKEANLPRADRTINAKGLIAIPGLIDAHVHLRDLQLSYKEDFYTGTCAAAAGGFTTVLDMPNTVPATDSSIRLKEKYERAEKEIVVNVGFHAGLTDRLEEISKLARLGAFSFKLNLYKPTPEIAVEDDGLMTQLLLKCKDVRRPVTVHAEDRELIERKRSQLKTGKKPTVEDFLRAHSKEAELLAVNRMIDLAKTTRAHLHICHLSAIKSLNSIEEARRKGLRVTCETSPHYIFLNENYLRRLKGIALTVPPVRDSTNSQMLWNAFIDSRIDLIATDHAPHAEEEKTLDDVWKVSPGIPGLETALPLLLTQVNRGQLRLSRLVRAMSEEPASIFGLRGKGRLKQGGDADLTLIDLKAKFKIDSTRFHSKAKLSPFNGFKCQGKPVKTFVAGKLVMDNGEIVAKKGTGSILKAAAK